jgi:hypothetical protein
VKKVPIFISTAAVSVGLLMVTAQPASAAGTGCRVEGGYGTWSGTWKSSTTLDPLVLGITDVLADGHHVGVQLVTKTNAGAYKNWSWHEIYGGLGDDGAWSTTAYDPAGIAAATVNVGVFEGDNLLASAYCGWQNR